MSAAGGFAGNARIGKVKEMHAQLHWNKSRFNNVPPEDFGFVYFMGADHGPIKIGWVKKNFEKRRRQLQMGNPYVLHVYALLPGGQACERALHQAMKSHRVLGEWFERDAVDALLAAGDIPIRSQIGDTRLENLAICREVA
jgi:hypothetical protein